VSSPDFRTFIGTLESAHSAWLTAHPAPTGTEFIDHYVGDPAHPNGLLWQYEQWRTEHGYVRVHPWNGTEALGRPATTNILSLGRVEPWVAVSAPPAPEPAGPSFADPYLAETTTQATLQSHFANESALGTAVLAHLNSVRTFNGDTELDPLDTALYSLRLWGFLKWASVLRRRFRGIPVFAIPIAYDADGVPLSDMEFTDFLNRWHSLCRAAEGFSAVRRSVSTTTGRRHPGDRLTFAGR